MNAQQNIAKSKSKLIFVIVVSVMLVLIIIMSALCIMMLTDSKDNFYYTETINGVSVKGLTKSGAYNAIYDEYKDFAPSIAVTLPNDKTFISSSSLLGYEVDTEKLSEKVEAVCKGQKSTFFPHTWGNSENETIELTYKFNPSRFETNIEQLRTEIQNNVEAVSSVDAHVKFDTETGMYIVTDETIGNVEDTEFSVSNVSSYLNESAKPITSSARPNDYNIVNDLTVDLYDAGWCKNPTVIKEQLEDDCIYFNRYLSKDIFVTIYGDTKKTLTPSDYIPLLNIGYNDGIISYSSLDYLSVDEEKLYDFVKNYCYNVNTLGINRKFTTSKGNAINLYLGDYGWWAHIDKTYNNFNSSLISLIKGESVPDIEIEYRQTASRLIDPESGINDDFGNTYIEISIADQHLWYYVNGSLFLETDVVTGNPNSGQATPVGIYSVTYTERNAVLTGPGYSTPVSYWMPIFDDVGLHDATWQPTFGGSRYLSNGSNGCINLPFNMAEAIFNNIKQFDPVIVY